MLQIFAALTQGIAPTFGPPMAETTILPIDHESTPSSSPQEKVETARLPSLIEDIVIDSAPLRLLERVDEGETLTSEATAHDWFADHHLGRWDSLRDLGQGLGQRISEMFGGQPAKDQETRAGWDVVQESWRDI